MRSIKAIFPLQSHTPRHPELPLGGLGAATEQAFSNDTASDEAIQRCRVAGNEQFESQLSRGVCVYRPEGIRVAAVGLDKSTVSQYDKT